MLSSSHDYTIVTTIIAMARSMGMKTVAEGVETVEQAQALAALGCDQAQGFYYGRPMSADDFAMHAQENRQYLDYYREMGMTIEQARGLAAGASAFSLGHTSTLAISTVFSP